MEENNEISLASKILSEENKEEILRQVGCRDLINLMKCRTCLSLLEQEGKYFCQENKTETTLDNVCGYWTENLAKQNEFKEVYEDIKEILKSFIDTTEENYEIITIWIIGTWMHEHFPSYPYLFFNATKGSGKTRVLKLIKELSKGGDMLASLSEAVLFRTTGTLCIDEFEGINNKDKNALRELLNTAYKKGGKVKRMKKVKQKGIDGAFEETQKVEEFNTFRPIVMANISGMEEVLQDRCITIVLEKSNKLHITRKIENFENDPKIQNIKEKIQKTNFWCSLCSVGASQKLYTDWNEYVSCNTTPTTPTYTTTLPTIHTPSYISNSLFEKIYNTNIDGRNLELSFPLFLIAEELGIFDKIIVIIKEMIISKRREDIFQGKDIMLIDFVSKQEEGEYYKINELTNHFRRFIDYEQEDESRNWLNNSWFGKALKRLNLVKDKRRLGEGIEVILDVIKAQEKIKMFR